VLPTCHTKELIAVSKAEKWYEAMFDRGDPIIEGVIREGKKEYKDAPPEEDFHKAMALVKQLVLDEANKIHPQVWTFVFKAYSNSLVYNQRIEAWQQPDPLTT
jgi:hypothetical protein